MSSGNFSTSDLLNLVHRQDSEQGDLLAQAQKNLYDLKRSIAFASKKNFTLEQDIRNLDKKIALLIRNRISLEEVIAQSGDISLVNQTTTLKDKSLRQCYGKLFYLLQTDTRYIATLTSLIKISEIDNLLQTVMFTLYGNQYDEYEEHLLLNMFQRVLENEFSKASNISGLLRANTALTRMMTTYTRRSPGQHYLKATLTDVLKGITSRTDLVLEINPLKVYELMVNDYEATTGKISPLPKKPLPEEAKANPDVQKLIQTRIGELGKITDAFISALIDSMPTIPYGIRWICKQIRKLMIQYFPDSNEAHHCSMIGGFFLLRFVNPAIVTPQAFMLVDTKLSAPTRRNLTLLAKVMQNLANNVKFGGVKEAYMEPLNVVLDRNRDRMNEFLLALTEVEDLATVGGIDKYIALGKTETTTINISLNEMYFIHALLQQNRAALMPVDAENNQLLEKILKEVGKAPPQLPRKENANVDLELDNSAKPEEKSYSADQTYAETKYLLFMIMKAMPRSSSSSISQLLDEASRVKNNPTLLDQVNRIKDNCKILIEESVISPSDDFAALRNDAAAELVNHKNLLVKTREDQSRLTGVLQNIQKHHSFLQEQFDAYKEYLGNVRQQSVCSRGKQKGDDKKKNKKDKSKKAKTKGPFKYSHSQLEKDGVIIESEAPEDRRSSISFSFSSTSPGEFNVTVTFGRRPIAKCNLG